MRYGLARLEANYRNALQRVKAAYRGQASRAGIPSTHPPWRPQLNADTLDTLGKGWRMALYHFSENADIALFRPHIAKTSAIRDEALVWAIDAWHAPMYFVPRDCPRVCFWAGQNTTIEDRKRWLPVPEPRFVMVVETSWLERIRVTAVYRYTLPEASFVPVGNARGTYISRETVTPVRVEPVGNLLEAIASADVQLRELARIGPLWKQLESASTLARSGIRLLNAAGYPEEFRSRG
jgi:hypothetical protein